MYLEEFMEKLESRWKGSLFTVKNAEALHKRAKEYLYRLERAGLVERVCWGWYYLPAKTNDPLDFLRKDKGLKVLIKQTASSFWNYDFVHRNVYRIAVEDPSYKKALEEFGRRKGWIFEVERHKDLKNAFRYRMVDGLYVENPDSCIVNCVADWSFLDAFATLYFRRDDIALESLKELGRWRRISKTDVRVWNAIKYGCALFNERFEEKIFNVRKTSLRRKDVRDLVEEAVEKVVEFA
jgi:hypothetical protein